MIESWDLTHRSQPVCGDVHLIVVSFQAWTQYCVEPEQVDKWVENLRKVRIVYVNNISSTTVTTVIVIAVIVRNYLFFLSHKSTASKKFNRVQRFLWRCWLTQGYVEQNHSSTVCMCSCNISYIVQDRRAHASIARWCCSRVSC